MDPSPDLPPVRPQFEGTGPYIGDSIQLFAEDGTETRAIVMAVEDDGGLVIQVEDGSTFVIRIGPSGE